MDISVAQEKDIPELVALINSAYRGEASKKGWTTEAALLDGDQRTDIPGITELMSRPTAVILKCTDKGHISGSVYLDKQESGLYLGMLTVAPDRQAGGIGKQLMRAAETYGKEKGCSRIFMNVISVRHELVAWYERLAYKKTGETKPFPADDRFGKPTRPLEFAVMQKDI